MEANPRRLARNEALFREVNERIEEVDRRLGEIAPDDSPWEFVCECANEACFERLQLRPDEYEAVRANAAHFVIAPGHEYDVVERTISQNERFAVVEKRHDAADIAAYTNPRG